MSQYRSEAEAAWLDSTVVLMPEGAKNFMCWRIVARRLYSAYAGWCLEQGLEPRDEGGFVALVLARYPRVRLSDWRFIDGEWEKEFDGLFPRYTLAPTPKRKLSASRNLANSLRQKERQIPRED